MGVGGMGLSGLYGPAGRSESVSPIHAALDAGINLLDTGDFYGIGHNELLIRAALAGRSRDNVVISVKFGGLRDPARGLPGVACLPAAGNKLLAYSLQRPALPANSLVRPVRPAPSPPIVPPPRPPPPHGH